MKTRTIRQAALAIFFLSSSGTLPAATVVHGAVEGAWSAAGSPYHATGDLSVGPGKALMIEAGVIVELDPGISLVVQGALEINGTSAEPVKFVRANASTAWGGVAVVGPAANAAIRHLELTGATVAKSSLADFPTTFPSVFKMTDRATVRIESSWFHDFPNPVIDNSKQGELTILDSLLENCHEAIHSDASYADIERVHIAHLHGYSDFIDFDNDSTPMSVIRDCVMEDNIDGGGDGIDTSSTNCLIENVVIKDVYTDKGFSLEGKSTPIIRNVLVINCHSGLVSKDSCTPEYHNVTVVNCAIAVRCYEKNAGRGGGHGSVDNMILWGNAKAYEIDALSSFDVTYSDVQGGYQGQGNIDADPLFVDAANRDFHLLSGSPAIGAGRAGADMGCFSFAGPPPVRFIRGDANGDGAIDISDPLSVLFYKFSGAESDCLDALDPDDSETVDVTDAVYLLTYLFLSGSPPLAPFPAAGEDPTPGDLDCQRH